MYWIRDSTALAPPDRPAPDALDPGFHGVRTRWIRGFMAFHLAQRMSAVMLMVLACPEFGFLGRPGPHPAASTIPHESAAAAYPHAPPSRGPLTPHDVC